MGRPLRAHGDIDVLLLRRDQGELQRLLADWELYAADPPGTLRPWREGEWLGPRVHDIWCRSPGGPWRIQVLFDESDGADWVSRRDPRLRRNSAGLGARTAQGIPYLAPEIGLFYKAQRPRARDETDFAAAAGLLGPAARDWLAGAIAVNYGAGHPWLARL
nr:amino acid transporter [Sciscionella sp. SE31]